MRRDTGGVSVDTQPAARKAVFQSSVTASGQIVAQRYADIGSSVMGRLVELRVKEGEAVKAGQMVARIDAVQAAASATAANARVKGAEADLRATADVLQSAQADLDAAPARAQEAQLKLQRTRDLRKDGLVPVAELDSATADCRHGGRPGPRRRGGAPAPPAGARVVRTPGRGDPGRRGHGSPTCWPRPISSRPSPASSRACLSRKARWSSWASRASPARR